MVNLTRLGALEARLGALEARLDALASGPRPMTLHEHGLRAFRGVTPQFLSQKRPLDGLRQGRRPMTSQAPEAASGPPLARESAMGNAHYQVRVANRPTAPTLTDSDPIALLARVAELEAELAVYRPPKPPPGWLPVKSGRRQA